MLFERVIIDNYGTYGPSNVVSFTKRDFKNITVISGKNGFGKTTFLNSLIWCLYGKHMREVDSIYKSEIESHGGYKGYIVSKMNKTSAKQGVKLYSVELHLTDVQIPGLVCERVTIRRTGYFKSGLDDLEILIDDEVNELTKEVGNELFIQDFILPREVARFFFFDSEKIVSLAESKSLAEKKQLNHAYTEVLGIKKYVELRKNLQDLRIKFRRSSAKKGDKVLLDNLRQQLQDIEDRITDLTIRLEKKESRKLELTDKSNSLQENLIRKGSALTVDDISNLRIDKYEYQKAIDHYKTEFKSLLELAPFAICYDLLMDLLSRANAEHTIQLEQDKRQLLQTKLTQVQELFESKNFKALFKPLEDSSIKELQKALEEVMVPQHFEKETAILHEFSESQIRVLSSIVEQLQSSYANRLEQISSSLKNARLQHSRTQMKLSDAENKESDGIIKKYRSEKVDVDRAIVVVDEEILDIHTELAVLSNQKDSIAKTESEVNKRLTIQKKYVKKDEVAERLILKLDRFIESIKDEKKKSMSKHIMNSLSTLMHKKGFIVDVQVELSEDYMDVILIGENKNPINKASLSKGEQQLYATSLLMALVAESDIEFPIMIDSPLQKFDHKHASNIIGDFYPAISKQVILFPLLGKEMSEEEYQLLLKHVSRSYRITHIYGTQSKLTEMDPEELFLKEVKANYV